MEERVVVRYYRKGGKLRGCVIGVIKDGLIRMGWSLYHKNLEIKEGIPFTKKVAREWALARTIRIPQSLNETVKKVNEQCANIIIKNMDGDNSNGREDGTKGEMI